MHSFKFLTALVALLGFVSLGCDSNSGAKSPKTNPTGKTADKHDHGDHDHPAHGPNEGHLVELTPDDLHAEWTHSSTNNIIKVFILDKEGKKNQPVKSEHIQIKSTTSSDVAPFKLMPVAPNDAGETAEFMLDSEALNLAMSLGVTLEFKVGDKTYSGKIEAHQPHDH